MNSKVIITVVVVVVLIILVGGYYYFLQPQSGRKEKPATENSSMNQLPAVKDSAPTDQPSAALPVGENVVEMTSAGFSPASVTVSVGATVRFVNKDPQSHWPASGVHPTHQVCAGLDALHPVNQGESYSFKFSVAKTCPIHDHLNPGTKGTVIVQ